MIQADNVTLTMMVPLKYTEHTLIEVTIFTRLDSVLRQCMVGYKQSDVARTTPTHSGQVDLWFGWTE